MARFLDKLKKYTPGEEAYRLLSPVEEFAFRTDVEHRMMEIDLHFDRLVPKDTLYALEGEIAKAYELNSVRISPSIPLISFL